MTRLRGALWNPIVAKEIRSRMRTWRTAVVLCGYLAIVGAVGWSAYATSTTSAGDVNALTRAGVSVFDALAGTVFVLVALLVPGLVGGAISGERERQTLDLLLCTSVHPARIVAGKLISSLLYVLLLVAATVPLFSVVFLLGGVSAEDIAIILLLGTVTAVTVGSLGMLCSTALRRTTSSTVSSYIAAFLLFVGPLIASAVLNGGHVTSSTTTTVVAVPAVQPGVAGTAVVAPSQVVRTVPSGPPLISLFSPITAITGTFSTVGEGGAGSCVSGLVTVGGAGASSTLQCTAVPFGGGSSQRARPADVLPDGVFAGWHEWEVGSLLDGLLAAAFLLLSVAVLRGRLPFGGLAAAARSPR